MSTYAYAHSSHPDDDFEIPGVDDMGKGKGMGKGGKGGDMGKGGKGMMDHGKGKGKVPCPILLCHYP